MAHPFPTLAHQILLQAGWGTIPCLSNLDGLTTRYIRSEDSHNYLLEEAWAIYEQEGPDTLELGQERKRAWLDWWLARNGELPGSERFRSISSGDVSPDALAHEPGPSFGHDPEFKS